MEPPTCVVCVGGMSEGERTGETELLAGFCGSEVACVVCEQVCAEHAASVSVGDVDAVVITMLP